MTADLKIGICLRFKNPEPWHRDWRDVYQAHLDYGARAEALGFDGIWVPEHHCVPSGYNPAPLVALTALSQVTSKIQLGTQPLLIPLHNPILAAEEAAVLDVLSGGRLIIGVGAGYRPGDFRALGKDRSERGGRMDEVLPLFIKALAAREPFDFSGRFYSVSGVQLSPPPVQTPHPEIQYTARSAVAAKRAARLGLSLNVLAQPNVPILGPLVAETAAAAGHNPAKIGVSLLRGGFLGKDREQAVEAVRPYHEWDVQEYDEWQAEAPDPDDVRLLEERKAKAKSRQSEPPPGHFTPEEWISAVASDEAAIKAVGLKPGWVNVTLWPPGMPLTQALDCLEQFAEEVLPHLRTA